MFKVNVRKCSLLEKCPHSKFFWSVFSRIWTEYGKILSHSFSLCLSSRSVRMRDNRDQKNSEYGHFLHSGSLVILDSSQENYCDETSNQQLYEKQIPPGFLFLEFFECFRTAIFSENKDNMSDNAGLHPWSRCFQFSSFVFWSFLGVCKWKIGLKWLKDFRGIFRTLPNISNKAIFRK